MPAPTLTFPPFQLDLSNACVWRGSKRLALIPKDFAVLHYLVTHAGRLVTKEELLRAVWAETQVGESVLKTGMQRIRRTLGDKATKPRYIETVHRRGYRFIAPITSAPSGLRAQGPVLTPSSSSPFVGREAELVRLHAWLEKARAGQRQLVCLTGEPGIGKTTLIEAFLSQMAGEQEIQIARGQCIERYGAGEAYMPMLEALGRLCRGPDGKRALAHLRRFAPTWLLQLSGLLNAAEREKLQRETVGPTQARMLREMVEAIEALSTEQVLIVWFEDLQWSDVSTLEWLAAIARRVEYARLLVIGTYRGLESQHPLRTTLQELAVHRYSTELSLKGLSASEVGQYVAARVHDGTEPSGTLQTLARTIQRRAEGNPLFVVHVVDQLLAQGILAETTDGWELRGEGAAVEESVPETLRQLIERQLDQLDPDSQRLLEAASVARVEFSTAAVAASVEATVEQIEQRFAGLARRGHFLQANGIVEWPDGTVAAGYRFLHALYQQVLYERLSPSQCMRLHLRIGERKEQGYGEQAREIATELAVHFGQARDYRRAIHYLQQAGEQAIQRSASAEAIGHLSTALELLKLLPDTPERIHQELSLQSTLTIPLLISKGFASSEVDRVYSRVKEICQQVGETPQLFPVLWSLAAFYWVRGELETAHGLAEQLFRLATYQQEPARLLEAHLALSNVLLLSGEFTLVRAHAEQGIALCAPRQSSSHTPLYGDDPQVLCLSRAAQALWILGYPAQALQRSHEALTLARALSQPYILAWALESAALIHQFRREGQLTLKQTEAAIALSQEQGFVHPLADGTILRGWALAEQGDEEEGVAQIREGLAACQTIGVEAVRTYYLALLAEAYERVGRIQEGGDALDEALERMSSSGEHMWEAELYRLKGIVVLQSEVEEKAEACFRKAIEIARKQSAKSLELRAITSLARLWWEQGKKKQAQEMLAEICGWFNEGFDTKDIHEAKTLLEALA